MASEELFGLLCLERGWSSGRWESFVLAIIIEQLGERESSSQISQQV